MRDFFHPQYHDFSWIEQIFAALRPSLKEKKGRRKRRSRSTKGMNTSKRMCLCCHNLMLIGSFQQCWVKLGLKHRRMKDVDLNHQAVRIEGSTCRTSPCFPGGAPKPTPVFRPTLMKKRGKRGYQTRAPFRSIPNLVGGLEHGIHYFPYIGNNNII